ncbi:MAG TPA: hypothetical protein V6C97_05785 [Oculatellaceae cyanobacterium]
MLQWWSDEWYKSSDVPTPKLYNTHERARLALLEAVFDEEDRSYVEEGEDWFKNDDGAAIWLVKVEVEDHDDGVCN